MPQLSPERYAEQTEASTAVIAALLAAGDAALEIPSCPGWTLRQLASHLGRTHRWAAQITATRSPRLIPLRAVPDGRLPEDPAQHASWLTSGARQAVRAIREAGQDPVWLLGSLAPASEWGRRLCHESVMHRLDAQLGAGQDGEIAPDVSADAIDEWLTLLSGPVFGRPDPRLAALPEGSVLHVHATDAPAGSGEWLIRHVAGQVIVEHRHGKGATALTGPADRLLRVLVRRAPADDPAVTVHGDAGLLARWLAQTSY